MALADNIPIPPVYYFVARESGDPKVILINQDEANLFKAQPVSPWSLYDIRMQKSGTLTPVQGKPIAALTGDLLKKLYFASFRHQVSGSTVAELAKSLDGICTQSQLQPSLTIDFKARTEFKAKDNVFSLSQWGFYGGEQQTIPIHIDQTKIPFKEVHEKRGVTILIGEGQEHPKVFISAKLNQRILASDRPKLKEIAAQIRQDHKEAMTEKGVLHKELQVYKKAKKDIIDKYGLEIETLEQERKQLITDAQMKMHGMHLQGMRELVDIRQQAEKILEKNLYTMSRYRMGTSKEFGIQVFGKNHENINETVAFALKELHAANQRRLAVQDNPKAFSAEEINKKIDGCIAMISTAIEKRYESLTNYSEQKNTTLIEEMFAQVEGPSSKDNAFWSTSLNDALNHLMADKKNRWLADEKDPDREKNWNQFVARMEKTIQKGKGMTINQFEQLVIEEVGKFVSEVEKNEVDVRRVKNEISYALSIAFKPSTDKAKNVEATKSAIINIVRNRFLRDIRNPSEQQKPLFEAIHDHLSQNEAYPVDITDTLSNPGDAAIVMENIELAVEKSLASQNIRVSKARTAALSERAAVFVAGQKWLSHALEYFRPVASRSEELGSVDGINARLFPEVQKELAVLDQKALDLQTKMREAKKNRKEQLEQLAEKHKGLPEKLEKNKETLQVLGGEVSAVNKLLTGIKKIFAVFAEHQVNVESGEPCDFLDSHFNLPKIIRDEISTSASLTFKPPEFYDVDDDMGVQLLHLHGLEETESQAHVSLKNAVAVVKTDAGMVKARVCQQSIKLQDQKQEALDKTKTVLPVEAEPTTKKVIDDKLSIQTLIDMKSKLQETIDEKKEHHTEDKVKNDVRTGG